MIQFSESYFYHKNRNDADTLDKIFRQFPIYSVFLSITNIIEDRP